jgi:hypothetical protein
MATVVVVAGTGLATRCDVEEHATNVTATRATLISLRTA